MPPTPARPRSTFLVILLLWFAFYASFTLFTPPLLDDADSVHAEVAREMLLRHDYVTLYANGIRYLEKAPLMYWSMAACIKLSQLFGGTSPRALAAAARFPIALNILGLVWVAEALARRMFGSARTGLYAALILLSSPGIFLFTRITLPDAGVCLWTTLALYAFWRNEALPAAGLSSQTPLQKVVEDIRSVVQAARGAGHAPRKAFIAAVPAWLVDAANTRGLDIEGYHHVIDGSAVRHVINRHGDPAVEASRGQLPISDADFDEIPAILHSPDRVVLGMKTTNHKDQIGYMKRLENGTTLYLEERRTGRRVLATVSMRKYPAAKDFDAIADTLPSNARGDGGTNSIIVPPARANKTVEGRRVMRNLLEREGTSNLTNSLLFATACALNVLTKGLIGLVFPVAIVLIYLLLTRGFRNAFRRLRELHPLMSLAVFLAIAAPWHILAGLANPTQGHPAPFLYLNHHWQVPNPSDGNVQGWFWFYFMNEHLLRYLNLRIPRDYDTSPLWLFWGLCFVWIMPWSAFVFNAAGLLKSAVDETRRIFRLERERWFILRVIGPCPLELLRGKVLLGVWSAFVLLFFSLSTRQEYYVLPAVPAIAILIAGWLSIDSRRNGWQPVTTHAKKERRANLRVTAVLLALGTLFALASLYFLLHTRAPAPNTDLAKLLAQDPTSYALSMGHFLDLNAQALGLFRLPLVIAALSLFLGPLIALILRKRAKPHAANLALATGAFGFLLAAHLGLQTFSPVLTSAHLAQQIAPQVRPGDLIAIHGEYESGSALGFYLQRSDIHILEGRSSNLWYGSFFPDAPPIFETPASIAERWNQPQRIFLWQSTTLPDAPKPLALPGPVYVLAAGGGKEILSNQPNK